MMHYTRVINGLIAYINNELAGQFNGSWQGWIIRTFAGLATTKAENIFRSISGSGLIKALDLVDGENINIELFMSELKRNAQQSTATINLPIIGAVTFNGNDVDALHRYIIGG